MLSPESGTASAEPQLSLEGCEIMGLLDGLLGHGSQVDADKLEKKLAGVLIEGEEPLAAFKIIRDFFVFTNKRLIMVDVQGITGSKVDYMSVPYKAITRFSVETAGTFDWDAEFKIWVSGSSMPIEKTMRKGTDVRGIQRTLAAFVLN
jgi:hypothetical protein